MYKTGDVAGTSLARPRHFVLAVNKILNFHLKMIILILQIFNEIVTFTNVSHIKLRMMIPRIVLEPSLLWFLYVGPNKEFFCSGPLQSSLARPGVCVFIKLFIFPTPWPGPGVDWQDWGPWRDDWRENKNSDKTISGWFLSLHRRLGRLGVSMFWFYPLTANDCSSVRFVWLAGLSLYLDLTRATFPPPDTDIHT